MRKLEAFPPRNTIFKIWCSNIYFSELSFSNFPSLCLGFRFLKFWCSKVKAVVVHLCCTYAARVSISSVNSKLFKERAWCIFGAQEMFVEPMPFWNIKSSILSNDINMLISLSHEMIFVPQIYCYFEIPMYHNDAYTYSIKWLTQTSF